MHWRSPAYDDAPRIPAGGRRDGKWKNVDSQMQSSVQTATKSNENAAMVNRKRSNKSLVAQRLSFSGSLRLREQSQNGD